MDINTIVILALIGLGASQYWVATVLRMQSNGQKPSGWLIGFSLLWPVFIMWGLLYHLLDAFLGKDKNV